MSLLLATGSATAEISDADLREHIFTALAAFPDRKRVLIVPPDITRLHSQAGRLTELAAEFLGPRLTDVLPALGTHKPMSDGEIAVMFGTTPRPLFRPHDWRHDVVTLGEVPGEFIHEVSEGRLDYSWPAQVNRLLRDGGHDLILSIGQVVPHEVVGMANGNKNIFIGTGGVLGIHRSHFLGAVYGMERMMGRADTPVRQVLNYAGKTFGGQLPQVLYVLTVVAKNRQGRLVVRGLFLGDDTECFDRAAALSLECNFVKLDREIKKAVVYLDPGEFRSTWLGNKSVYRTRMAMADGGELIVLAPGVREFGEDPTIDRLIRRHGYKGTSETLAAVKTDVELGANLSAAAHLIHGSSEGRFHITYAPGHLSPGEIESAGYGYADLLQIEEKYQPGALQDGWNLVGGEEIFYISNPGLGLWAYEGRLQSQSPCNEHAGQAL